MRHVEVVERRLLQVGVIREEAQLLRAQAGTEHRGSLLLLLQEARAKRRQQREG